MVENGCHVERPRGLQGDVCRSVDRTNQNRGATAQGCRLQQAAAGAGFGDGWWFRGLLTFTVLNKRQGGGLWGLR